MNEKSKHEFHVILHTAIQYDQPDVVYAKISERLKLVAENTVVIDPIVRQTHELAFEKAELDLVDSIRNRNLTAFWGVAEYLKLLYKRYGLHPVHTSNYASAGYFVAYATIDAISEFVQVIVDREKKYWKID